MIVISEVEHLVPSLELAAAPTEPHAAFVVGFVVSPERIAQIRRNRVHLVANQKSSRDDLALYAISGLMRRSRQQAH